MSTSVTTPVMSMPWKSISQCQNEKRIRIQAGNGKGEREEGRTSNAATTEVGWNHQVWKLLGRDFALADCSFEAGVGIFEDVE